jgi:5'-nucleotidase
VTITPQEAQARENELMNSYDWILFDADETLFHFDAYQGLRLMFSRFDVDFTHEDYLAYQLVNKPLWVDYQNGVITAYDLQIRRFSSWADQLNVSAPELNSAFQMVMAEICAPMAGAVRLLDNLRERARLGIITNGFTEMQRARLERTGLEGHFDLLVISEQVGVAKPHRDIFDHALNLMGEPERERVLMVGDTLESDIVGGINAGLHTCWLNTHDKPLPNTIAPNYHVRTLSELESLLLKS